MLAANETVAQHFYWLELPFVYRGHDVPNPEKLQKLAAFINNFGYYMKSVGRTGARKPSSELFLNDSMNLQIRIPPDRRCKMAVIRTGQPEMPRTLHTVFCLFHAAQRRPGTCLQAARGLLLLS